MIPGLGASPGKGKGYLLQYSGLENSMDCIVPGVTRLNDFHFVSLQFIHSQLLEEQVSTASPERGINVIKISSSIYDSEIPLLETALCHAAGLSHVQLFGTTLTEARQAPLSMGILQARILEWVAMPSSETALSTNTKKKKIGSRHWLPCWLHSEKSGTLRDS